MVRFPGWPGVLLVLAALGCGGPSGGSGTCSAGDQDGMSGGSSSFVVHVSDQGFAPLILSAENNATITLTVINDGSRPHDLVFDCLATPNTTGCPAQSCFPAQANIASVAPGATVTTTFVTPNPEGIYVFRSDAAGDPSSDQSTDAGLVGFMGQFIVM